MKDEVKTQTPTERQSQFLAYIFQYSVVNGGAPAEADMQRYFQISAPSVHSMVLTLERRGLHPARARTGAQPHLARATGIVATLETRPTVTRSTPARRK